MCRSVLSAEKRIPTALGSAWRARLPSGWRRLPVPQDRHDIFSDLVGSTALGEALDSEALREVLDRHFDEMSACVERHGGIVEKYIGDAVMAVFGLPRAHEDDAMRALRAAVDMRNALTGLTTNSRNAGAYRSPVVQASTPVKS